MNTRFTVKQLAAMVSKRDNLSEKEVLNRLINLRDKKRIHTDVKGQADYNLTDAVTFIVCEALVRDGISFMAPIDVNKVQNLLRDIRVPSYGYGGSNEAEEILKALESGVGVSLVKHHQSDREFFSVKYAKPANESAAKAEILKKEIIPTGLVYSNYEIDLEYLLSPLIEATD